MIKAEAGVANRRSALSVRQRLRVSFFTAVTFFGGLVFVAEVRRFYAVPVFPARQTAGKQLKQLANTRAFLDPRRVSL